MGKLHELLAVEPDAEGKAKGILAGTISTLRNKEQLFSGQTRTLTLFANNGENSVENEAIEAKERINRPVAAIVPDNLNYVAVALADYYDVLFQKNLTNNEAKADIVLDGVVIVKDVPATFLLTAETRLVKEIRPLILEIPTLDPAVQWTLDENIGRGIYRSDKTTTLKTQTDVEHVRLQQSTDKHADTFTQKSIVKNIGKYEDQKFSGLITSADKARYLENLDRLIRAIKEARQRANTQEVSTEKIGDLLFKQIFGSIFSRQNAAEQLLNRQTFGKQEAK